MMACSRVLNPDDQMNFQSRLSIRYMYLSFRHLQQQKPVLQTHGNPCLQIIAHGKFPSLRSVGRAFLVTLAMLYDLAIYASHRAHLLKGYPT